MRQDLRSGNVVKNVPQKIDKQIKMGWRRVDWGGGGGGGGGSGRRVVIRTVGRDFLERKPMGAI